jgi:hypothetical protein
VYPHGYTLSTRLPTVRLNSHFLPDRFHVEFPNPLGNVAEKSNPWDQTNLLNLSGETDSWTTPLTAGSQSKTMILWALDTSP